MNVELTCPLGSKCEEIKDNKLYRCHWYTEVMGKNPQSTETINEWRCAIAWLPILTIEMSQTNRGQTQAIGFLQKEMTQGQKEFNKLWSNGNTCLELTSEQ